jgi:hypothetical protein
MTIFYCLTDSPTVLTGPAYNIMAWIVQKTLLPLLLYSLIAVETCFSAGPLLSNSCCIVAYFMTVAWQQVYMLHRKSGYPASRPEWSLGTPKWKEVLTFQPHSLLLLFFAVPFPRFNSFVHVCTIPQPTYYSHVQIQYLESAYENEQACLEVLL